MHKIILFLILLYSANIYCQELNVKQLGPFSELRIDDFEIAPNGNWLIELDNSELLLSADGGINWTPLFFPDSAFIYNKYFFDDSRPVIFTDKGLYHHNANNWEIIDLPTEYGTIHIYKNKIFFYTGLDFFVSEDAGVTFDRIGEISDFKVLDIRATDSLYYVVGDAIINARTTIRTYDQDLNLIDESTPLSNFREYRFFQVGENGKQVYTITQNYGGADGTSSNTEYAYGGEFLFGYNTYFYDLVIFEEFIIYSFKGQNLGVYNTNTGEFKDIEIGTTGKLTTNGQNLYLSSKTEVIDLTNIVSENFTKIIPNLKRDYYTISNYKVSSQGIVACNTGYNIYTSINSGETWNILELGGDRLLDYNFNYEGNLVMLGNIHYFDSKVPFDTITSKPHGLYGIDLGGMYGTAIHIPGRIFSTDDLIIISTSSGGLTGSSIHVSIDQGETWDSNYPYGICSTETFSIYNNALGTCDSITGIFQPLWDYSDFGIGASYYDFSFLPVDDSLIHFNPVNPNILSYISRDLGQSLVNLGRAPLGEIIRGVDRNSSFVYHINKDYLYFRKDLESNYSEIDITSIPDINNYQSSGDGNLYMKNGYRESFLYKIDSLIYHPQTISGQIFIDQNDNCLLDSNEEKILNSWQISLIGNGIELRTFSVDGEYNFYIPKGIYTLRAIPITSRWDLCEEEYNVIIDTDNQVYIQDVAVSSEEVCSDLKINLSTPIIRRGRVSTYYIEIENIGNEKNTNSKIDITLDTYFEISDYNSDIFLLQNDSILTLNLEEIDVGEKKRFSFDVNVSASAPLGHQHCVLYELDSNNCCQNSSVKSATEYKLNTGPYDPNDMRVFNTKSCEAYNVYENEKQIYHIRFQNTGNDTSFNAKIHVNIDSLLDLNTLEILNSSHDLLADFNDIGELIFRFDNILLPDSTTNEIESHGFVRYRIQHKELSDLNHEFNSVSAIYFDYNAPVITNIAKCKIGLDCGFPIQTTEVIELCAGEEYNGYRNSGVYYDILTSSLGCDSISIIDLRKYPRYISPYNQVYLCKGDSYLGQEENFQYSDSLTTVFGCDSIVRYSIRFNEPTVDQREFTICRGDTVAGYYESGIYTDTITSFSTCRYRTLTVHVIEDEIINEDIILCEGESYNGYTLPGLYSDTTLTANGCKSIYNLSIELSENIMTFSTINLCFGDNYNGINSGTIIDTLISYNGCDSIVFLSLFEDDLISSNDTILICPGDSYNGFSEEGDYTETYESSNGCDSIVNINIEWLPIDHDDCMLSHAEELEVFKVDIFPNPANDILYIRNYDLPIVSVMIYNSLGQNCMQINKIKNQSIDIEHLSSGINFISILSKDGSTITKKFLKL